MNRLEFLGALERALMDIPEEEREEALNYYNDYLADAGVENEKEAIESLGMPEQIAQSIRADLNGRGDAGEFTEQGFYGGEKRYVPSRSVKEGGKENSGAGMSGGSLEGAISAKEKKKYNGWKVLAIVLLCVLLAPICLPLAAGIFAAALGLVIAALGLFIGIIVLLAAVFLAGFAVLLAGILVGIGGLSRLFFNPAGALVTTGAGILMTAAGLFLMLVFGWLFVKSTVFVFRGLVNLCRKPFHKRKGAAV